MKLLSISVVSHGQWALVKSLLTDIFQYCASSDWGIEILLTLNIPESVSPVQIQTYCCKVRGSDIKIIQNMRPQGFGANHNSAFVQSTGDWFCVVNPDIRLKANPFDSLLNEARPGVGLLAPGVLNPQNSWEDSARKFPTIGGLIHKLTAKICKKPLATDYPMGREPFSPDWVAGMFLLMPRQVFAECGGFDTRYFLYYEDVDLCARLWLGGKKVVLCPRVTVIHAAQRSSHRNLKYSQWHLCSLVRYFASGVGRRAGRLRAKAEGLG